MALAVLGLGALGFLVGPALLDFFALEGDRGFGAALVFFSAEEAADFLAFAAAAEAAAALFFSAAVFFALGEACFLAVFEEALSEVVATAVRLADDFFVLDAADEAGFLLSEAEATLAPPEVDEASLNEPDAPLPFV
jgi:hypothetical protein